jgi:homoserine dehydrogenase
VAGAIPVIRPLTQSLAGDTVLRVAGIVNGTTNYILSEMASTGADYSSALADASALGYAEADPTADVEGYDAAAKAAILASIAFHTRVTADDVYREGITKVSSSDFDAARALGCTIKLLAICERITSPSENGEAQERVSARVYPALVPLEHPLATVNGAFNAVVVEAAAAGRLMFYGQGAGGNPTASAVMGDVVMAARNRVQGGRGPRESRYAELPIAPIGIIPTRYYFSMTVKDRPGVFAAVATEFGKREVSIAEVRQEGIADGVARIVVVTHRATDAALSETVAALAGLDVVEEVTSVLRLEGTSE